MKRILNRNMPSDFVRTGLEGVFLKCGFMDIGYQDATMGGDMFHANIQRALLAAVESIIYADPARRLSERCWSELMISPSVSPISV